MTHEPKRVSCLRVVTVFPILVLRIQTTRLLLASMLLLFCANVIRSQSNGPVDPAKAAGTPTGSYSQSAYEDINLYNGRMSVSIPLLDVVGRGTAQYAIRVPVQIHQWNVLHNPMFQPNGTITYDNVPVGAQLDLALADPYGPGLLEVVTGFDGAASCVWTTVTRVVLRTPNGAEIELRDNLTDGQPNQQNLCFPNFDPWVPFNRGKTFHSSDGSAVAFISDADVIDRVESPILGGFPAGVRDVATGTLIMRDGTRYRYEQGVLKKMTDRNGNTLIFQYESFHRRVSSITDSLGRVVSFTYGDRTANAWFDEISYTGMGGASATIRVNFTPLSQTLRPDQTFKTPLQLFPNINRTPPFGPGPSYDPKVLSSIVFPNNKQFLVAYNSYAEVARLTVPTGGYIDYEYGGIGPIETAFFTFPDDTGVVWSKFNDTSGIQRKIKERRTYSSSVQLEGTTLYKDIGMLRPVTVDHLNTSGGVISSEKHHFFVNEFSGAGRLGEIAYVWWKANKEFKTEWLDASGQALRTVEHNWQQRAPVGWFGQGGFITDEPANDPRIEDTTTTLNDTGQVSKTDYTYDQFNNITEEQVFDFGQGTPGGLLTKTQTDYLAVNSVNSLDYTSNAIHIVSLPKQIRILGPGTSVQARTEFEYDNYNDDTNNKPLLSRPSIIGLDPAPGGVARGNLTKTQNALNVTNGDGPKKYTRYDVAGNIVTEKDPRGFVTETRFDDSFTDGISRNTFAYPTLKLTPIPDTSGLTGSNTSLTTATVYDFRTGLPRQSTDANGLTTTTEYDLHGRVTRIVRPSGGGETNFEYSDVPGNLFVRELIQQDATRSVETRTYLDGFGKTVREFLRTGVGVNPWVVRDVHYDELGRISSALEPYSVSTPGPTVGVCGQCTFTTYDALNRVKTVVTPDGATFQTTYAGNAATSTDQAGRTKKVIKDVLGQTREIIEDPTGIAQSTTYEYDALGNVRKIVQAQQQRFYAYDALSQLVRVRNVEDNVNSSLPALTDSLTGNSQWARAMTYDENGNVTQQTDARGVVTTFTYDRLNRNTGVSYANDPSGTLPVNRIYDFAVRGKGKPYQSKTTGTGGSLITVESYNNLGSPLTLSQKFDIGGSWSQPYTVTYAYNLSGGVTSLTYPSGRSVSYHYDDAARTDSVTGDLGDATSRNYSTGISYTAHGRMSQELFGTGVYNKRFYNSRNQLAEVLASTSGNDTTWNRGKILNQFSMQCASAGAACNATDNNGNVRRQEVFVPTNEQASSSVSWSQQYDYDALNRLLRVREFTGNAARDWQQEYTYDRWSNRRIHQTNTWGPNIPKPNFGVNAANNNRLTAPSGFSMTYDATGNVNADTYSGILERVYDAKNLMTQAKDNNNVVQSYVYDADGRRIRRKINGLEIWQIFGLNQDLLAEYPANGSTASPQKEYGYRNGELLVVAENSSPNAPAPSALTVTPPAGSSALTLSWTAAPGAVKYRIERKSAGGSFTSIGTTTSTSMPDNSAVTGSAYLYKVCSADSGGTCTSGYSNIALGAAITFSDPTLVSTADDPSGATATPVRALHITQLRTAVNAVRTLAGISNATWTWNVVGGGLIHVEDIRDLRTALAAALTALGIDQPAYIDQTLKGFIEDPANATKIKADHVRQLRQRVTSGTGGSGGPASSSLFSLKWLISDHLGTPRIVLDLSGSLNSTKRFDYLPFGEALSAAHGIRDIAPGYSLSQADQIRQDFTGKERDNETGLDYFGARYYSSIQGRFTGPDTFGGAADNPQTLNLYLYVNNNPLRATDPNGHWTFDVFAAFFTQDPAQQPTTPPVITEKPNPGNWVKVTELGVYNPIEWTLGSVTLDGISNGVKDAQKWIGSRTLFSGLRNPFSAFLGGNRDLGIPDYEHDVRYPRDPDDFKQFNFSIPLSGLVKFAGIDFAVTRTRHGNWFLSNGASVGLAFPGLSPALVTGQTRDSTGHVRQEAQVNAVLEGHSFGARGCLIICFGGSANTTRLAYLFNVPYLSGGSTMVAGFGTPQINIGKQVTYKLPFKW